jgi:hypothetical protein
MPKGIANGMHKYSGPESSSSISDLTENERQGKADQIEAWDKRRQVFRTVDPCKFTDLGQMPGSPPGRDQRRCNDCQNHQDWDRQKTDNVPVNILAKGRTYPKV